MQFKDNEGREWKFKIDYFELSKVQSECGVNLSKALDDEGASLSALMENPFDLLKVMACLLESQMKERDVDFESFGRSLNDEEVVGEAVRALIDAILNFSPADRRESIRKAFRKVWTLGKERDQIQAKRAIDLIESPDFDEIARKAVEDGMPDMATTLSSGVSDSPEK